MPRIIADRITIDSDGRPRILSCHTETKPGDRHASPLHPAIYSGAEALRRNRARAVRPHRALGISLCACGIALAVIAIVWTRLS